MAPGGFLHDPALAELGVDHGFGMRGASAPAGTLRPRQVHGVAVALLDQSGRLVPDEADAVVCARPGIAVAVVTADCVPILLCSASGRAVAAVHAGWRGLAAGVIGEAVARLASVSSEPLTAAVGPHIRSCCYEIDAPVIESLTARFGVATRDSLLPSRPGHHFIDLSRLVVADLLSSGVSADRVSAEEANCTACDANRFESYRRDGSAAARLVHWIAVVSGS